MDPEQIVFEKILLPKQQYEDLLKDQAQQIANCCRVPKELLFAQQFTQGWRYFECECGKKWREACRDYSTQSSEVCPECFDYVLPAYGEEDLTLPIDENGNLINKESV